MLIKFNIVKAKSDETEAAAAWLICIYLSSIDPDKKPYRAYFSETMRLFFVNEPQYELVKCWYLDRLP